MPNFIKTSKWMPPERLAAEGILEQDREALNSCQRECSSRLGITMQLEQEAYLTQHPEIGTMLKLFIAKVVRDNSGGRPKVGVDQAASQFFLRPAEELDLEIRTHLGIDMEAPYYSGKPQYKPDLQYDLERDILAIVAKHYPLAEEPCLASAIPTPDTVSSSFISIVSSDTTLPTPEPVPTPEPTLYEVMYQTISNVTDKAIFSRYNDEMFRYDYAYVELMRAVEEAMEVPVLGVREDIAALLYNAYYYFELDIMEKERIAAEIAWEKRMRKKLKSTLRRMKNFKGYETPPTPTSTISSHESYLKPPMKPCSCQPVVHYNRIPKDRFGIYMPHEPHYPETSITLTPAYSREELDADTKSNKSGKT